MRVLLSLALLMPLTSMAACEDECITGNKDCPCYSNGTCNGDGSLVCSAGTCRTALCKVGTLGCACFQNFTCAANLRCVPDPQGPHCEEACPAGDLACACLPGNKCSDDDLVCTGGICDSKSCPVGTSSCHCFADGSCGKGLECIGDVCRDSGTPLEPPANPKCYTPCKADLELGGGVVRPCSREGLMDGCVGNQVCVNGSCVPAPNSKRGLSKTMTTGNGDSEPSPPTCSSDIDCPDFQTCIAGGCYSNCDRNDECPDGRQCYRHVCRRSCTVNEDTCPAGDHCQSTDGDTGVCMPEVPPSGARTPVVEGSFTLSDDSLAFSNVRTQMSVVVTNDSPQTLEFTVKRAYHTYVDDLGVHNVTDGGALAWLSM